MKSSDMINKIRTLLDLEIKLEELKLDNGTVVEAESFEKGNEVFIKTEDEKVAMPVGEYSLEDGRVLFVEEVGLIADIKAEEEKPEEVEEELEHEDGHEKEEDKYASVEEMKEVKDRISKIEMAIEEMYSKDLSKETEEVEAEAEKPLKSRTVKEEYSKTEKETKEEVELSEPATNPIKHSPEGDFVKQKFHFGKNRRKSVLDRVFDKINEIN